jgi:hypothetical protein
VEIGKGARVCRTESFIGTMKETATQSEMARLGFTNQNGYESNIAEEYSISIKEFSGIRTGASMTMESSRLTIKHQRRIPVPVPRELEGLLTACSRIIPIE